jgi:hypothetical protein
MKVIKIKCNNSEDCQTQIKSINANVISILHLENNHIVIEEGDYNVDGSVKKSSALKSEIDKIDLNIKDMVKQMINLEWK